jgi:hypothetical protein
MCLCLFLSLPLCLSSALLPSVSTFDPQSKYCILVEMKQVQCICPLSWSVHCNFNGEGKCSERGWACTPHPYQPGPILPSSLNVRQKAAVATLCTLCFDPWRPFGVRYTQHSVLFLICLVLTLPRSRHFSLNLYIIFSLPLFLFFCPPLSLFISSSLCLSLFPSVCISDPWHPVMVRYLQLPLSVLYSSLSLLLSPPLSLPMCLSLFPSVCISDHWRPVMVRYLKGAQV